MELRDISYLPPLSKTRLIKKDSGADDSFLDAILASELGIPTQPLSIPLNVRALDGRSIVSARQRERRGRVVGSIWGFGDKTDGTVIDYIHFAE